MMNLLTVVMLGIATSSIVAPIPPEPTPDPTGRGYIGISVGINTMTIERVEPNLPADRAGLKAGDSIVRVGTLHPQAFEEVVAQIMSYRPGAIIEVEVQRGSERKTFKVKIASRPLELDRQ